jgi:hypothetical protein
MMHRQVSCQACGSDDTPCYGATQWLCPMLLLLLLPLLLLPLLLQDPLSAWLV